MLDEQLAARMQDVRLDGGHVRLPPTEQLSEVQSAGQEGSRLSQLLVTGIPPSISKDHLLNFIECLPGVKLDVEKVESGTREGAAIVTFENAVDMADVKITFSENPIEETLLCVSPIDTRGAILIRNPHSETTTSCFKFYLSNSRRSGGDKVEEIIRDADNRFLIAYFRSHEVAVRVSKKEHVLDNHSFQAEIFDPNLEDPEKAVSLNMDKESAETNFVSESTFAEKADGDCKPVHFAGDAPEITVRETEMSVSGIHHVYRTMLESFSDSITSTLFSSLTLTFPDTDCVIVKGQEALVERVYGLLNDLLQKQKSSTYLASVPAEFTEWEELFDTVGDEIEKGEYFITVRECLAADELKEEFCVGTLSNFFGFDEFLESLARSIDVPVEGNMAKDVLSNTAWDEFVETDLDFGKGMLAAVKQTEIGVVTVFGSSKVVETAADTVRRFLQNAPSTETLWLSPMAHEFLYRFCKSTLNKLQTGIGHDAVEIVFEGDACKIKGLRRGVRKAYLELQQVCTNLKCSRFVLPCQELAEVINSSILDQMVLEVAREKRCIISDVPDGLIKDADVDGEDWGSRMATIVQTCYLTEHSMIHVVDGTALDMAVDAVVVSQDQHDIPKTCFPSNDERGNFGARLKASEQSNFSADNREECGVTVIPSGALPCKALIQFNPQSYYWQDDSDLPLKHLVRDILQAAQHHHFTSLAIPVLGVDDRSRDDGLPINIAVLTLVEAVCDYIYNSAVETEHFKRDSVSEGGRTPLQDVCLCSGRAACVRGLLFVLDDYKVLQPPDRDSYRLLAYLENVRKQFRKLGKEAIQIVFGDISKIQADAVVVPLDLDLDLDKSKVTRSLLTRGGQTLEMTLLHGEPGWLFSPSVPRADREQEFETHGFLVGKGGWLSASYVFYVYLPPWGPQARKMMTEVLRKSLFEASKKKLRTVAFAVLGTGKLHGYPAEFAARTMLSVISDCLEQETNTVNVVKIVIFPADQENRMAFSSEHSQWLASRVFPHETFGRPHHRQEGMRHRKDGYEQGQRYSYAAAAADPRSRQADLVCGSPYSSRQACSHSFNVDSVKITLKVGNIVEEKSDFIVNSTNQDLDLTKGGVSKALVRRFGPNFESACSKKDVKKKMRKKGFCITPAPQAKKDKKILHINWDKFSSDLPQAILKCLEIVRDAKTKCWTPNSVAFPLLGTGAGTYNPEDMVLQLMKVCQEHHKKLKHVNDVRLVMCTPDHFQRLVDSARALQPVSAQKQNMSRPPAAENKENLTTGASANPPAKLSVGWKPKGSYPSRSIEGISLFIVSDREENREDARDELTARVENLMSGLKQRPTSSPTQPKGDGAGRHSYNSRGRGHSGHHGLPQGRGTEWYTFQTFF